MSKLAIWLTPLWLLATGVAIGVAVLAAAWLIVRLVNPAAAQAISRAVGEGVLRPFGYVALAITAYALAATPTMPVREMFSSLTRLTASRPQPAKTTVPARTQDFVVELPFRSTELQSYEIVSEQDVAVNVEAKKGYVDPLLQVRGGEPLRWAPGGQTPRTFEGDVARLYVTNDSDADSELRLDFQTDVEMTEVHDVPRAAVAVIVIALIYLAIRWLAPRTAVIADATAKETLAQPLFVLLTVIGAVALLAFVFTPYNTFGEDVKMLKTTGMTTIKVLAILMALWAASSSVSEEIEGRTALTVLSKPVGRRQFVIGKFLGIAWPVVLMFVLLGAWFLFWVSFKVVYDARESAKVTPQWTECHLEVVRIVPGLLLALMESLVLAAISVAVSTRLSMLPNLVICGAIYVLGHLAALIVRSSAGEIEFVRFIGRLLSVVLPVLDHYEIEGAIAGASSVPAAYLWWALAYSALYCTAALLIALILFEDRDLA